MSDDHTNNHYAPGAKKSLFSALRSLFHDEPKNRDELVGLIRDSEQNELIDPETRDMLEGVMDIAELRVRDIMIPRSQIVALNCEQSLEECLEIIMESAHSRFPVISENKDHILGLLLAKDLLPFLSTSQPKSFDIKSLLRPAVIVPESKRVDQMLKEFRAERYHMAIVIDEFGGVSGLVTIEDILELIVGEIDDEYDKDKYDEDDIEVRHLQDDLYLVSGLTPIEDFNKIFSTHFSDDEWDTIGGLVMQTFGHLPTPGEAIVIDDYTFEVSISDSLRIIQLKIQVPPFVPKPNLDDDK